MSVILEKLASVVIGAVPCFDSILAEQGWSGAAMGEIFATLNPSTEAVLAHVSRGGAADVNRAVGAAAAARAAWAGRSAAARGALLFRLADAIVEHRELIAQLECREVGKPISAARGDVDGAVDTIRYNAGAADKLQGATIPVDAEVIDFTLLEPLGVTAHIVPWNFPIGMAARSIAPALAAGCTAVLKPAEQSSLSAIALCELALQVGIPPGVITLVTGFGPEAGQPLCSHPQVRGITFTGSVETGRAVYQAAATGIKPVVLELGGKNPLIVFDDADIDRVVGAALMGGFENCGQVCAAASRILAQERVADRLAAALTAAVARLRVGPATDDPDLGPLVSAEQRARVLDLLARSHGQVLIGGGAPADARQGYFVTPTVLDHVPPTDPLARQEAFGPVVTLTRFNTEDEALAIANGLPYGLVAGIFTSDISRALRLTRALEAGSVWVNGWFMGGVQAPNGGVKDSGIGRERGLPGLMNYVAIKNVAIRV